MMTTVKAVYTGQFEIILSQVQVFFDLDYVIQYKRTSDEIYHTSENIKDFNIANFMYEAKLQELEGH